MKEIKMRPIYSNELWHFRTPGSKNGVRLYQYKNGKYTPLGRIHYGIGQARNKSNSSDLAFVKSEKDVERINNRTQKKNYKELKKMKSDSEKMINHPAVARSIEGHRSELNDIINKRLEYTSEIERVDNEFRKTHSDSDIGTDDYYDWIESDKTRNDNWTRAIRNDTEALRELSRMGSQIAEEVLGSNVSKTDVRKDKYGNKYYAMVGKELASTIFFSESDRFKNHKEQSNRNKDVKAGSKHENAKKNAKNVTSMEDIDIDYQNYKQDHPGTKMSIQDFQDWYYDFD